MLKTVRSVCLRLNSTGILFKSVRLFETGSPSKFPVDLTRTGASANTIGPVPPLGAVNIRKATLSDYDSVVSIPSHGNFFDSLPDRYCAFISTKSNTGYVANVDGKDVGFELTYVIDDGSTLVLDDLRVKDDAEIRTVMKSVLKYIQETRDPKIKSAVVCLNGEISSMIEAEFGTRTNEWELVATRLKETFNTTMGALLRSLRSSGSKLELTKRLFERDIMKVINSPELFKNLIKDGRVLKSGIPYRLVASNVPLIMDKRTLVVGSNMKNEKEALASFGTYSHTKHGLYYSLSFYGNTNEHLDEHLYVHMMSLLNRGNKSVTFEIYVNGQEELSLVRDRMTRYNFNAEEVSGDNKEVVWYETPMPLTC